jgi:hypothetical protein
MNPMTATGSGAITNKVCQQAACCPEPFDIKTKISSLTEKQVQDLQETLLQKVMNRLQQGVFKQQAFRNFMDQVTLLPEVKEKSFSEWPNAINECFKKFLTPFVLPIYKSSFLLDLTNTLKFNFSFTDSYNSLMQENKNLDTSYKELSNSFANVIKGDIGYNLELEVDETESQNKQELVFVFIEKNGALEISKTIIPESQLVTPTFPDYLQKCKDMVSSPFTYIWNCAIL